MEINTKLPDGEHKRTYFAVSWTMPEGDAWDITNVDIEMVIRGKNQKKSIRTNTFENGGLVRQSERIFEMPQHLVTLPAGEYEFEIVFYYPGRTRTYLKGDWIINSTIE